MNKPEPYLTENGNRIFKELVQMIDYKTRYKYQLTILSDCLDQFEQAARYVQEHGNYQETGTGYRQVNPEFTVKRNMADLVLKYGVKFGLNPDDLKKLGGEVDGRTKEGKLKKFMS